LELEKLKKHFKKIPKSRYEIVENLIQNAAFMTVALADLQNLLNEGGIVSEYKNGANQFGTKKSPEVEVYNVMIKNYAAVIRQLTDLLPDSPAPTTKKKDAFEKLMETKVKNAKDKNAKAKSK
jgi:hypothetical protein